jgi:hypothetical protein
VTAECRSEATRGRYEPRLDVRRRRPGAPAAHLNRPATPPAGPECVPRGGLPRPPCLGTGEPTVGRAAQPTAVHDGRASADAAVPQGAAAPRPGLAMQCELAKPPRRPLPPPRRRRERRGAGAWRAAGPACAGPTRNRMTPGHPRPLRVTRPVRPYCRSGHPLLAPQPGPGRRSVQDVSISPAPQPKRPERAPADRSRNQSRRWSVVSAPRMAAQPMASLIRNAA